MYGGENWKRIECIYNPEKYYCVAIDDEIYIDDWWDKLAFFASITPIGQIVCG